MSAKAKVKEIGKKMGNYFWSKNFLFNFLGIIAAYMLGYFILNGCLDSTTRFGEKVKVPDLIGKNQNNVKKLLNGTGLEYQVLDSIYDPTKVEGTILSQDPEPTSISKVHVKSGRTIHLRVSKRTQLVEVPNLIDKSQRFGERVLINRNFRYSLDYKPSKEAAGAIMEQRYKNKPVAPGTPLPIGSRIKLIVGRDEAGVPQAVPNLYGLSIKEAKDRVAGMLDMEFQVVCPECISKSDSLAARVDSQSPEFREDAQVASGGTILIHATLNLDENAPE